MANIDRLADEIANDPLGRGYSTMTDQEVADDLNTAYRTYIVEVSSRALLVWAGENGRLKKIDAARTDSNAPSGIQNICEVAMRLIERDEAAYDPNDSQHADMVAALVNAGVIAQADADSLNALGERSRTRAEELNLLGRSPEIGPAHINQARAL
jgi:hypothetical protein